MSAFDTKICQHGHTDILECLIAERDALKAQLEMVGEDRDRWAGSACRLEPKLERTQAQLAIAREAITNAMNNLGVPQPEYPYPVAHAYDILKDALSRMEGK